MGTPLPNVTTPSVTPMRLGAGPDRLDSWKEIATYLRREVRTVQLWEKREGLPVHRHFHNQLGTVFAFRSEIEAWGLRQAEKRSKAASDAPVAVEAAASAKLREKVFVSTNDVIPEPEQKLLSDALQQLSCEIEFVTEPTEAAYEVRWKVSGSSATVEFYSHAKSFAIWSRRFDLRAARSDDSVAQIAEQISQSLWLQSVATAKSPVRTAKSPKSGAREAYLKGRYFWDRRNEEGLRKAVGWFRTAIQQDPEFALPYTGLADSLTLLSFYEIASPADVMPEARDAALRAIEIDPDLAEAHTSLADVHLHFDRHWEAAGHEYRRAIQCNPGYALGYHWYANLLAATGQHDAAYVAVMHALEIDPVSLITQVWAGVTSHLARRFDDAIRHYQSALELDPQFTWAHMYMAQALEQKGLYCEALEEFDTTNRLAGGSSCVTAMKAHAHAIAGDRTAAQDLLRQLRRTPEGKCMPSYDIAATYAALGDSTQSVRWLKRACSERNMKLFTLSQDPRFDALRHRAEFRDVVENLGLGAASRPQPRISA